MYQELASKLYIPGNGTEYCQPIVMDGYNAVCVDVTVITASIVTVTLQCSNDSANWSDVVAGTTTGSTGPSFKMFPHTVFAQIAAKYVRVKLTSNATPSIVAVGINCANIGA